LPAVVRRAARPRSRALASASLACSLLISSFCCARPPTSWAICGSSAARQILAAARQGQFGLALPLVFLALQRFNLAFQVAPLGNRAHRGRTDFNERILHFLNDQADDLLRILGTGQDGIQVGVHDVGEAGEDAHGGGSFLICRS